VILDAHQGDVEERIHNLRQAMISDQRSVPGNLAVRNFHRASEGTVQALLGLLTIQGADIRCGLLLLSRTDIGELRARSLLHGQLLGSSTIAVIPVSPLRARREDIGALARVFIQQSATRLERDLRGISPQAISRLESYEFPGNVAELERLVEQAVLRSSGDWLAAEHFPQIEDPSIAQAPHNAEIVIRMPGSSLREIELQAIRLALRLADGRIVRAADLLGITRHALRRKLEKYGLQDLRRPTASYDAAPEPAGAPASSSEDDDAFI
jgi:DNA-binding NtrC family response regulator